MKRVDLMIIFVIVIVPFLYTAIKGIEMNGFCISEFSHLDKLYTRQELIDKAILFSIKRSPTSVIYHNDGLSEKNLEIFKQINPDCCQFSKKGPENYTNPAYVGYIIVKHKTFDEKKYEQGGYKRYIAYDSCGNLYDRYIN